MALNITTSGRFKDGVATCTGSGATADGGEDEGGSTTGGGDAGGVTTVIHPAARTAIKIKTIKDLLIELLLLSGRPDTLFQVF
jgi:hypothetical protein